MLTAKGRATVAGGAVLLTAGLALANPLFLAVGGGLLLLVAVSAFFLKVSRVTAERTVSARVLQEEQEVKVDVQVKGAGHGGRVLAEVRDTLPDIVELHEGSNYALLALKGDEDARLTYLLHCPVKGRVTMGPLEVRVQDAFGYFHHDHAVPVTSHLTVYPREFDMKDALVRSKFPLVISGDYQVGNPGLGSTFFALREYQTGDSIRSVNWKASARSGGKLVVNQTERESQARVAFLLDARTAAAFGTPRRNGAVFSARAAASIGRFILRRRDRIRIFQYGDGVKEIDPRGDNQDVVISEALAAAGADGDTTLDEAVDALLPTLKRRSPVVIFSNLLDDPSILSASQKLLAYEARVLVVSPDPMRILQDRGLKEGDLEYDILKVERDEILASLKGYGAWVVYWDPEEPFSVTMAREANP